MTRLSALTAFAIVFAIPAFAETLMHAHDAYARFLPGARSGAAFMVLENHSDQDDRLIGAFSRIAGSVGLHTHIKGEDGLVSMREVPEGFAVPAGQDHAMSRGGDHLMFVDLTEVPADGGTVPVTLVFEKAGEVTIDIPVDNARKDAAADGGMENMDHSGTSGDDGD
jgi:periplasmic copper chaperone A